MSGDTGQEHARGHGGAEALSPRSGVATRASQCHTASVDLWTRRITRWLTLLLHWVSAHWLLLANLAVGCSYIGLPVLAPVLMHAGQERAANLIYLLYRPLCHQLPERSFFLYGERWVYSYQELSQRLAGGIVPPRYTGAEGIGFKIAVCQRDVATYAIMLLAGVLYAAVRGRFRPLSIKQFGLMIVPIAIDGLGQLFGLWESTWWSRVVTGGLFGLACVWLSYPHIQPGMSEIHTETAETLKRWER